MDPNEALKAIRESVRAIVADAEGESPEWINTEAAELAEQVIALDEWIEAGGFLPDAWRKDARNGTAERALKKAEEASKAIENVLDLLTRLEAENLRFREDAIEAWGVARQLAFKCGDEATADDTLVRLTALGALERSTGGGCTDNKG